MAWAESQMCSLMAVMHASEDSTVAVETKAGSAASLLIAMTRATAAWMGVDQTETGSFEIERSWRAVRVLDFNVDTT